MYVKRRKKLFVLLTIFVVIIIALVLFSIFGNSSSKFGFDYETNKLVYSAHRAPVSYSIVQLEQKDNYATFKIVYKSKDFLKQQGNIHALLYLPKGENIPGIVFLPGGGVRKEDEPIGPVLANLGYAVLIIDQRGIGETGGFYPNYEQDGLIFNRKKESIQHLGVYDALLAVDVLRNIHSVDKDKLAIGGASMGGRYALIAAALDMDIKFALIISSAGFHIEETNMNKNSYFLSIDPDRYIKDISPSKLVMIHGINDSIIGITDAAKTFALAYEPKSFYAINNSIHGYNEDMKSILEKELKY